ncbi:transcription termination/antitermination protein NusG [Pseudoflavitalea rhizosphaerae]|uniref:transcription termination/antitermination protein NusG n=1 Tax=Pseudoflavitalea rhizosphaerae TaxID=1884793 RepID=UPI000F8E9B83|nr:UpxY family transcription antiterminator [Pseudoflavitalea rhizosphaerae]
MSDLEKWYALYTRPCQERKVAQQLLLRNIQHYCPLKMVQRQWSDRKKIIHEPLFTSYVFVRLAASKMSWVRDLDGVVDFVQFCRRPAIIRDEEIEAVRQFLKEFRQVRAERIDFRVHDKVQVVEGIFMNMTGDVVEVLHKTVKVAIPSLGYQLVAEMEKSNLRK